MAGKKGLGRAARDLVISKPFILKKPAESEAEDKPHRRYLALMQEWYGLGTRAFLEYHLLVWKAVMTPPLLHFDLLVNLWETCDPSSLKDAS